MPPLLAIGAFALIWRATRDPAIRLTPIFLGLALALVYTAIDFAGSAAQSRIVFLDGLDYNWLGKALGVIASLTMIALVPYLNRRDVGLTWRQRPGSVRPALIVIAGLFALGCAIGFYPENGTDTVVSHVAFQATLPGIDEELFFRGVLLALFLRGFGDRWNVGGAALGPAAAMITFLFGAGHGFSYADGGFHFNLVVFFIPGFIGFLLLWIRQRTGSILLGVFAHNLFNVTIFVVQSAIRGFINLF